MIRDHQRRADVSCPEFGATHFLHTYTHTHSLPNVPLSNKHTSVMNWLCQPQLEHLCLKTSLQEVFNLQTQNIVEFHTVLIKDTYTNQPAQKGITCNQMNIVSKTLSSWHLNSYDKQLFQAGRATLDIQNVSHIQSPIFDILMNCTWGPLLSRFTSHFLR